MKEQASSFSDLGSEQLSKAAPNRLFLLDLLKAMSITAVVSYHALFVPLSTYEAHAFWVDVLFAPLRFCVPVLLSISFLLLEYGLVRKPGQSTSTILKKRLGRLLVPTGFWFAIAAGLKLATGNAPLVLVGQMLTGEIFTGSYFLVILFQLTLLFVELRSQLGHPQTLFLTLLAQGLVFVWIDVLLLGSPESSLIPVLRTLDRPLFIYWFGYIALGLILYYRLPAIERLSRQLSWLSKTGLLGITGLALLGEYAWLWHITEGHIPPFDYLMLSCLGCVPVLFLVFASVEEENLPWPWRQTIAVLSKYSLGIFCLNGILSQIFLSLGSRWFEDALFSLPEILLIRVVSWGILLALSLGLSMGLARLGLKSVVC